MDRKQVDSRVTAVMDQPLQQQAAVRAGLDAAERIHRRTAAVALCFFALGGLGGYVFELPVVRCALTAGLLGFLVTRILFWVTGHRAIKAMRARS